MEYNDIFRSSQFMCREHVVPYSTVSLANNTPKKLMCAKCLDGHISSNLADIEDVLSLKAIAEYENKCLNQHKKSANDVQKICKEVLAKIDVIFARYTEQLQKMKSLYKKKILSIVQENTTENLSQELFALTELLKADLINFNEDPNLICDQSIEEYLRNFDRLRSLEAEGSSNVEIISKTI